MYIPRALQYIGPVGTHAHDQKQQIYKFCWQVYYTRYYTCLKASIHSGLLCHLQLVNCGLLLFGQLVYDRS